MSAQKYVKLVEQYTSWVLNKSLKVGKAFSNMGWMRSFSKFWKQETTETQKVEFDYSEVF